MANTGKALKQILVDDATVKARFGGATTRIYPFMAKQNDAFPYVTYNRSSKDPTLEKDRPSRLDTETWDIHVFDESFDDANDASEEIRTALDGFIGTKQSVVIDKIVFENSFDLYDDTKVHHRVNQYRVRIKTTQV